MDMLSFHLGRGTLFHLAIKTIEDKIFTLLFWSLVIDEVSSRSLSEMNMLCFHLGRGTLFHLAIKTIEDKIFTLLFWSLVIDEVSSRSLSEMNMFFLNSDYWREYRHYFRIRRGIMFHLAVKTNRKNKTLAR